MTILYNIGIYCIKTYDITGWSRKIETLFLNFKVICKEGLKSKLKIFMGKIFIDKKASKCRLTFFRIMSLAFGRSMQKCMKILLRRKIYIQSSNDGIVV